MATVSRLAETVIAPIAGATVRVIGLWIGRLTSGAGYAI